LILCLPCLLRGGEFEYSAGSALNEALNHEDTED
jgi:hypothetical protein